jgi:hypothetical protein
VSFGQCLEIKRDFQGGREDEGRQRHELDRERTYNHGENVDGNGHQLGVGGGVPKFLDDGRDSSGEAVYTDL